MANGTLTARRRWATVAGEVLLWVGLIGLMAPIACLILLSLGSGWTYPNRLPDRLDLRPWRRFFGGSEEVLPAILTTVALCVPVGLASTLGGLVISRHARRVGSTKWLFIAYLPFIFSPVVLGSCLYDLAVRVGMAGTLHGVMLCQLAVGTAFATVLFYEFWGYRIDRYQGLIESFGGSRFAVWRHGVWPPAKGLIAICLIQTTLFSWLDYGLVSTVGGGNVRTLTVMLFGYLREGGVNQAAMAGTVLMVPAVAGFAVCLLLVSRTLWREDDSRGGIRNAR